VRAERRRCKHVGADSEPELGEHSSEQRYDTTARQGSARGDDGSGTYKATGSARWPALKRRRVCAAARCGTAGNTQAASSQGSVQPRLEGWVHNKVKASVLTSRSGHGGEEVVTSSVEWPGAGEAGRRGPWLPQRHLPCAAAPLLGVLARRFGSVKGRLPQAAPASGVGDGLQLHRPVAQQCRLPLPLLFFSSRTVKQRLQLHGDCALLSAFSTPPISPSSLGLRWQQEGIPQGAPMQGRRRILGAKSPKRRRGAQGDRQTGVGDL
jgi:hypothetical protein